jgi:hypothetical protein
MFPFGGSTAAFPIRPLPEWDLANLVKGFTSVLPGDEAWNPVAKAVIAGIINAVGQGDYEEGVYDRPEPVVHPVFSGPDLVIAEKPELPDADDSPEFLPGWLPEWKKTPDDEPGWIEDQWVYPAETEEEHMSHTWGHLARDVVGGWLGTGGNGGYGPVYDPGYDGLVGTGPTQGSGKVTVDTKTGKVTKCGRRRRRRLLTPTDLNDLAALKTIVGGGQAMNFAVMKAVRR